MPCPPIPATPDKVQALAAQIDKAQSDLSSRTSRSASGAPKRAAGLINVQYVASTPVQSNASSHNRALFFGHPVHRPGCDGQARLVVPGWRGPSALHPCCGIRQKKMNQNLADFI